LWCRRKKIDKDVKKSKYYNTVVTTRVFHCSFSYTVAGSKIFISLKLNEAVVKVLKEKLVGKNSDRTVGEAGVFKCVEI